VAAMVGNKKIHKKPELDRIIHEPARLQIISYLATGGPEVAFSELGEKLELSSGNLSVQLKKLEEAGYLSIAKSFKDNRPLTSVTITRAGMEALKQYLNELERMISLLKTAMPDQNND
jgi:DNA-binding MarR family transcriptional regulator